MAIAKRVSRTVTKKEDIDFLIGIKYEDITKSLIMELFGEFNGKRRFNTFDVVTIPSKGYGGKLPDGKEKYNKQPFTTTVGRFVFNKFFVESVPYMLERYWYIQENFGKKAYGRVFDELGYALLEDEVSLDVYKTFCMKVQAFMAYIPILAYNHTDNMLTISKRITKRKNELIRQNQEAVDKKDIVVIDRISKELLAYAKELMKDDPAMDMFDSGGGGSFDENFKNIFIMRGTVMNPDPAKGYDVIFSNYIDGISKEEYTKISNTLAAGPYARSKKTELGGYWEKLFSNAIGSTVLLDKGTDCGTKRTIDVNVTSKNIDSVMYNYVVEGDNLVEINSHNKHKFIGRKIKMRYSSMCEAKDGICNKCAGELYYKLGIRNVGIATSQIPSKLKLISMKAFHDDMVRLHEMDPMRAFFPDN